MGYAELVLPGPPPVVALDSRPKAHPHEASGEEGVYAVRAQAGDADAFGHLVQRYAAVARRVARVILQDPDDADDAAQDAFLAAWRKIDQYDPRRPFRPWFMKIVTNTARDLRRARRVRETRPLLPDVPSEGPTPAQKADSSIIGEQIDRALADLPERQRLAVIMFDVEGYAHADIAAILGVPQGTVRSLVFHGRRALRNALSPIIGDLK